MEDELKMITESSYYSEKPTAKDRKAAVDIWNRLLTELAREDKTYPIRIELCSYIPTGFDSNGDPEFRRVKASQATKALITSRLTGSDVQASGYNFQIMDMCLGKVINVSKKCQN